LFTPLFTGQPPEDGRVFPHVVDSKCFESGNIQKIMVKAQEGKFVVVAVMQLRNQWSKVINFAKAEFRT
jgi:hypothetical protein